MSSAEAPLPTYTMPGGVVPSRADYKTALSCWRGYVMNGKYPTQIYEAQLAMGAHVWGRSFHSLKSHPNGRRLFRDKPDVLNMLMDDDYLATLPAGSVGHAYRSFLTTNRLDAGVYDVETVILPLAEKNRWDEDYFYFIRRLTALHDVFHVLGGYGPDMAGEVITIGFTCGQMEPAAPTEQFGYVMAAGLPGASIRHKLRVYRQAIERGRRADKIVVAPWEEMFDLPLDDVRALLGIAPHRSAHPAGTWYTKWTPKGINRPTRWDYEAVLAHNE